ncbi:response regulator transcription factor [Bacillus sp. PK3-037]|uniref:response regulator transcription factor n=1 Tax=Bacillus TaxID=1386 RepID=UPI000CDE4D53|nr:MULTISPECIES: response regulator transcription factor [Bacillus]UQZ48049.1 DNA-binding response regulator [Bacillus halotolerans]MBA5713247.1 DNA-binding response regulator [Bacillus subtilis]MDF4199696.1 response regulator transcription factor [Bacillus subtilis]MDF4216442.1 response regulator transcription factor [Bacillus subtilis]POX35343.1 DNA-binding response regulator [Bacillus sp. Ru63]
MHKVLIIEDDKSIAEIEKDYLEMSGYQVTIQYDGEKGMREALDGQYHLILLDLMLPNMDGFEICQRLRESLHTPILMVTAKKEDIDKIRGLGKGADDYIVKPFSPSELVARVKAHISRFERLTSINPEKKHSNFEEEIIIGDLHIYPKSRQVYIKDIEIELKNKEYELLLFLVTHANIVFSKDDLYEKVWGLETYGDTSTVTVHINRLREKIEENLSEPRYIQTIWGAGYRFKS